MNLKSKIFGFAAASVFALSMTAGVSAATSDYENVSVNLKSIACSASIDSGDGSFGVWEWNGNEYEKPADSTVEFSLSVIPGSPTGKCPVTLGFTGLSNGTATIDTTHFSAKVGKEFDLDGGTSVNIGNYGRTVNYPGSLTLNSVPDDYAPGSYNGSVVITTGATLG